MTGSQNPAPAYRADIDGLRGIAVLAVVAFHAFPRSLPGGFVGVDVFFVISGFLISSIILKGLERGAFSLRDFYVRRVARIFPALVVVLLAVLVVGWFVMLATEFRRLGLHTGASGAFVANFVFWRESGYFDATADLKPLLHLWSLGVEEQFYLVWPPLLVLAARRRIPPLVVIATIGVASFATNVLTTPVQPDFAFFLPPARLWELLLGAWLAHESLRRRAPPRHAELKSVLGLAFLAAGFIAITADGFPGWWALLPTVGAGLLIAAGPEAIMNQRLLAQRPMVFVGLISYPLYLWHWPVLAYARLTQPDEPSAALRFGLIGASIVLAWATYVVVERPLRFGRFVGARWRTPGLASAMVLVSVAGVVAANERVPPRLEARYGFLSRFSYDYRRAYRGTECHLSDKQTERDFRPTCVDSAFGTPGRTSILLWGDSHAAHLYPGLRSLADSNRLALAQFSADACPPVLDDRTAFCRSIAGGVLDRVSSLAPDVVVLASRWSDHTPEQVARSIAALQTRGVKRIVVVGPVPRWARPLPNALLQYMQHHSLDAIPERLRTGFEAGAFAQDTALRTLFAGANVRYVSAMDLLCRADGCLTLTDGQLTAWDAEHLTDAGSRVIARAVLLTR